MGEIDRATKAIKFMLRNEDYRYDTKAKLENLGDGAGLTFIGLTEKHDTKYLPFGMTIKGLANLYSQDKLMALAEIIAIYREKYWNKRYDFINDERLAIRLFDFGVNCGIGTAVKILQKAVNIAPTGKFDEATVTRVNETATAYTLFKKAAEGYYRSLRQFPKFGRGWLNRLNKDEYSV
jgi:lysozyme family protein